MGAAFILHESKHRLLMYTFEVTPESSAYSKYMESSMQKKRAKRGNSTHRLKAALLTLS